MDWIWRNLTHWLELDTGEGTPRLEFASTWLHGPVALTLGILAVTITLLLIRVYQYDSGQEVPRSWARCLIGLRLTTIAFIAIALLQPQLAVVSHLERPGKTLVLLDMSQSMAQQDLFVDTGPSSLAGAWQEQGINPRDVTRADLARSLLQDAIPKLQRANQVHVYGFGGTAERLLVLPKEASPSISFDLGPKADESLFNRTNLAASLLQSLEQSKGEDVAGVVLITDGRSNAGPKETELARILEQQGVPEAVLIGVGDPTEYRQTRLIRATAPTRSFRRDPFDIRAVLEREGPTSGSDQATVALYRTAPGPRALVASRSVRFPAAQSENRRTEVVFDVVPDQVGRHTYDIEIEPQSRDKTRPDQRRRSVSVQVIDEQSRVLLIAGGPSHEYRTLKTQLIRDRAVNVSCWLQSAKPDYPQEGNTPLDALPADRETLSGYDVFILLDPDPRRLTQRFCESVRARVLDDGAGLWWVCGETFTLAAAQPSASTKSIVDVLPVSLDVATAERSTVGLGRGFDRAQPWELSTAGTHHRLSSIDSSNNHPATVWRNLPGYYFAFPVLEPKPAATVLLRTRSTTSSPGTPMYATHFVDNGRVSFLATDETHEWRPWPTLYDTFWLQGIRFLSEGLLGRDGDARLSVDREVAEIGTETRVFVEMGGRRRATPQVRLIDPTGNHPARWVNLQPTTEGHYEGSIRPPSLGTWSLELVGYDVSCDIIVGPSTFETHGPADFSALQAVEAAGAGAVRTVTNPRHLRGALEAIEERGSLETIRTTDSLWDNGIVLAIVVSLLGFEWWLRKRVNLL